MVQGLSSLWFGAVGSQTNGSGKKLHYGPLEAMARRRTIHVLFLAILSQPAFKLKHWHWCTGCLAKRRAAMAGRGSGWQPLLMTG